MYRVILLSIIVESTALPRVLSEELYCDGFSTTIGQVYSATHVEYSQ